MFSFLHSEDCSIEVFHEDPGSAESAHECEVDHQCGCCMRYYPRNECPPGLQPDEHKDSNLGMIAKLFKFTLRFQRGLKRSVVDVPHDDLAGVNSLSAFAI